MAEDAPDQREQRVNFARVSRLLAQRYGRREALVNTERGRRYSFLDLHLLSNRIANMMTDSLGLGAGDRYMLILRNDNLSLMHFWTILKSPAVAVFGNVLDRVEEHLRQAEFLEPKVVFLESDMLPAYREALIAQGVTIVAMDGAPSPVMGVLDFWELVGAASREDPETEREVNHEPAFIRLTGGTTGNPKCAVYAYRHFEQTWRSARSTEDVIFNADTRLLHFAPLSHGTLLLIAPTFFEGGCSITQNAPDLVAWCHNVERERITTSFLVPTLLYRLLTLDQAAGSNLSTLSTVIYGAAPMSPAKLKELQAKFGNIFVQVYGSTESFGFVTCLSKREHLHGNVEKQLETCGRALPGYELIAVDDDSREVPSGEIGELWHRHRGVIDGYFRNPEATASDFADGWWKSGDLARIDEQGYITIVDRKKDMVITGGFNVYALEVETALSTHPAVLMCAVVGVPHPDWGEAIHSEVVLRPNVRATAEELIAHVRSGLGGYKAPKTIAFVDELPLSSVGKVLRRKIRDKYWKGSVRRVN